MRIIEMMGMGISDGTSKAIAGSCLEGQVVSGSAQTDATAISAANVVVTTSSSNQGVILPADAQVGDSFVIGNNTGNTIKVYPPSGGQINGGGANTAKNLVTVTAGLFTRVGPTHWVCVTTV